MFRNVILCKVIDLFKNNDTSNELHSLCSGYYSTVTRAVVTCEIKLF